MKLLYIVHFSIFDPCHEIMELFVLILQIRMRSHPVQLDVWFLVGPFVYFHTSCERRAKTLARLSGCAGSSAPLLVAYVISTIISRAGPFLLCPKTNIPQNYFLQVMHFHFYEKLKILLLHPRFLVWFDFCFTALQHILGHFGHSQLI